MSNVILDVLCTSSLSVKYSRNLYYPVKNRYMNESIVIRHLPLHTNIFTYMHVHSSHAT